MSIDKPLKDIVAVVTGASRGVGRGVAVALGKFGATVFVTGRSSVHNSVYKQENRQTIEDTATIVTDNGGQGIAVVCDHRRDDNTKAVFQRVYNEFGKLDILINNAWGGNELPIALERFWELDINHWDNMFLTGVRSNLISSRCAAKIMIPQLHGTIVNISFRDNDKYIGHFMYDLAKNAINRMSFSMSQELRQYGITVLGLSPGFVRTELVLEHFGADERTWAKIPELQNSESPEYTGRAVVSICLDKTSSELSGYVYNVGNLARRYNFTDIDGSQPLPFNIP